MTAAVEFKNVSKSYGRNTIVEDMNMIVESGTFTVIFGAPGSGKSVLLRLITGLEKPDQGEIFIRGESMNRIPPGDRNIGYVPQSFALYPHYSVFDNIGYPLKLMGMSAADIKPIVESTAEQLKIGHLLQKRPDQCSGGEKQRVAIARGIVKNTRIFILDDPLTGLDFKLREQLFEDLRLMKEDLDATFIYTTSDALEALMLAEWVNIFDGGNIIESGELDVVYGQPEHARTMQLLGFPPANVFPGSLASSANGNATCNSALIDFPVAANGHPYSGEVLIGLRPQDIQINPVTNGGTPAIPAEITLVEDLGGELVIYLDANGVELEAVVPRSEVLELTEGEATIAINPERLQVYQPSGERVGHGAN